VTIFQFDENNECKQYIKRCNKEGFATAKRFPRRHKNKQYPDVEMLNLCLSFGAVLITFDNDMIDDHEAEIPQKFAGVVIIEHSAAMLHTITQKSAEKIIRQFKETIADWHKVPFENSVVRITDASIMVGRKINDVVIYECQKDLDEIDCATTVTEHLIRNAQNG
jgi:hypothetical protein